MFRKRLQRFLHLLILLLLVPSFEARSQRAVRETVILISIDGFRADYIEKFSPATISSLAAGGTRAKWMRPVYPTKTFPNHYTLVTGLYPGTHGLIENNMYDMATKRVFGLGDRAEVSDPMWWAGEPVWNTLQKQGGIAASFFWPGSETKIGGMQPRYWRTYEHKTSHEERVDQILAWLDLPSSDRPNFITGYFSDVDDAGHAYGPESSENKAAVLKVDEAISRLKKGLKERRLDGDVHIILVSDHGMAEYRYRNAIIIDEMFDLADAERVFWVSEFTQIFPRPGREEAIYRSLREKLPRQARVYRSTDLPVRWRIPRDTRIAPLIVVPEPGHVLLRRERFEKSRTEGTLDKIRGAHGYDNRSPDMRAFFIGYGKRFRAGRVAEPFDSVDVYEVICRILEIKPAPNDGNPITALRLVP